MSADVELLIERLRAAALNRHVQTTWPCVGEAADTIEALRAERDAAVKRAEAAGGRVARMLRNERSLHSTIEKLVDEGAKQSARADRAVASFMEQLSAAGTSELLRMEIDDLQSALTEANARADAEWNKAIEAAAAKGDIHTLGMSKAVARKISDAIRALRRDAGGV